MKKGKYSLSFISEKIIKQIFGVKYVFKQISK